MMPLKIEILENEGSSYDITVLGIGNAGKEAVRKYPCPAYGENHWAIQTLTLCDDDAFQHKRYPKITTPKDSPYYLAECRQKICEVVNNSDILFVIADISKDPDYENAFRFANLHHSESEKKWNVLIDCSEGSSFSELILSSVFDLILSYPSTSKTYRPIEMLLSDMYTQCVGLDFADVKAIVDSTPKMKFFEERVNSSEKVKEAILRFDEEVKKDKWGDAVFNALLYFSIPHSGGLEIVEGSYDILESSSINGNVVVQFAFNAEDDDETISISLMCGRECIKDNGTQDVENGSAKEYCVKF